jgi:predicted DNA-binding protein
MPATTRKAPEPRFTHRLGSLRVTPEMGAALDRRSAATGQPINEIVRNAIAAHLQRAERAARRA